jgi:hypothetical protein
MSTSPFSPRPWGVLIFASVFFAEDGLEKNVEEDHSYWGDDSALNSLRLRCCAKLRG